MVIQVGEYLLNNGWVFDTGDDPDITTALTHESISMMNFLSNCSA
jgi:hypothetical protein